MLFSFDSCTFCPSWLQWTVSSVLLTPVELRSQRKKRKSEDLCTVRKILWYSSRFLMWLLHVGMTDASPHQESIATPLTHRCGCTHTRTHTHTAHTYTPTDTHTHTHTHTHAHILRTHACMHACTHAHTYTHTCAHAYAHTHTHTHTHTCIYMHAHMYACKHTYTHTCTHIQTHRHTHRHTHTHTQTRTRTRTHRISQLYHYVVCLYSHTEQSNNSSFLRNCWSFDQTLAVGKMAVQELGLKVR